MSSFIGPAYKDDFSLIPNAAFNFSLLLICLFT